MRAELPWNVAGIPPEAREAVRAAARREGLSVGEWLTRRILNDFSGAEDPAAPALPVPDRAGAPGSRAQPAPRDGAEVPGRAGRSENESGETWRRVEEQLRGFCCFLVFCVCFF